MEAASTRLHLSLGEPGEGILSDENEKSHTHDQTEASTSSPTWPCWMRERNGILKRLIVCVLPSFLSTKWQLNSQKKAHGKHVIASLDGLRGIGCFFVFNDHFFRIFRSRQNPLPGVIISPFISLFWGGHEAVSIFFVISGYVLSYRSLQLIRSQQFSDFQKAIASSVLRRVFRLCLPPFLAACILCLFTILGGFDHAWTEFESKRHFLIPNEAPPKLLGDSWLQFRALESNGAYLINSLIPWTLSIYVRDYFVYDPHIWTIPQELRCSMALFTLLVGTSRMRTVCRLLVVGVLVHHVWNSRQRAVGLFFIGMFFAECDLLRGEYIKEPPNKTIRIWRSQIEWSQWDALWVPMFVIGWFLLSSTQLLDSQFLPYFGTCIMVWAVANSTCLQAIFTNAFAAYLGKISYALYLVHGGVIRSLGYVSLRPLFAIATGTSWNGEQGEEFFSQVTGPQRSIAYMLGNLLIFPLCIWLADLFCRAIDEPCVKFARFFDQTVSIRAEGDLKSATPQNSKGPSTPRFLDSFRRGHRKRRTWTVSDCGSPMRGNHADSMLLMANEPDPDQKDESQRDEMLAPCRY